MGQIVQALVDNVSADRQILDTGDTAVLSTREFSKVPDSAIGTALANLGPGLLVSAPVLLSAASAADVVVATITPAFHGRIVAVFAIVTTPVTTAGDSANLRVEIDGDPILGGTLALTSANATPAGKVLGGTKVIKKTGVYGSEFQAGENITFAVSGAVEVFLEGAVVLGVLVAPARVYGPANI